MEPANHIFKEIKDIFRLMNELSFISNYIPELICDLTPDFLRVSISAEHQQNSKFLSMILSIYGMIQIRLTVTTV